MFKDFPNLHPLVVHFPIVLILVSAALQAVLVFKDRPPVRWITLAMMAGGFAGALAASTVFHAMPVGLLPQSPRCLVPMSGSQLRALAVRHHPVPRRGGGVLAAASPGV